MIALSGTFKARESRDQTKSKSISALHSQRENALGATRNHPMGGGVATLQARSGARSFSNIQFKALLCPQAVGHAQAGINNSDQDAGAFNMKTFIISATFAMTLLASVTAPAEAKGCLKGAAVGGVAGHMAGHGALGAAGGCAVGHHEASKQQKQAQTQTQPQAK